MQLSDDNLLNNSANAVGQGKDEKKDDWLNEHGQPNFEYLQSLANEASPEALLKLKTIADDLDVTYSPGTTTEELIGKIRLVVRKGTNIIS